MFSFGILSLFLSLDLTRISCDRRGEEHSFILKPATTLWKNFKTGGDRSTQQSLAQAGNAASSSRLALKTAEGKRAASTADQYAIMVSCRCNYTGNYIPFSLPYIGNLSMSFLIVILLCMSAESRLFFKQPTSWRPRISRDLMISVASEMSGQSSAPNAGVSQLPVQVSYTDSLYHMCMWELSFFFFLMFVK